MHIGVVVCLGFGIACAALFGQGAERLEETRAGQIEARREDKARHLNPDVPAEADRVLQTIKRKKIIDRITGDVGGWRPRVGGLVTGSGFAAGPEYFRRLNHDRVKVYLGASASIGEYYRISGGASLPRLANNLAFLDLEAARLDYPHIDYYGPGPNSSKSGRTGFRLENSTFEVRGGLRPTEHWRVGGLAQFLMVNVGPGADPKFAPTERVYSEANTPGVDVQSNFLQSGAFIQYDYRDVPGGPRNGGNYMVQFSNYSDVLRDRFSFKRLDAEVQQYFSIFNNRRVFALRGRTSFTDPNAGQAVPFYLEPSLGGADTLRGFRPFRFYDRNSIVLNGEYRWEVFSGLDMALFADAGRVFHRWQDITLADLETSYGFGFRFNVRNAVFMRIDTGFSREGFQVWLKFGNVF